PPIWTFRVMLGVKDQKPTDWSGKIEVVEGEVPGERPDGLVGADLGQQVNHKTHHGEPSRQKSKTSVTLRDHPVLYAQPRHLGKVLGPVGPAGGYVAFRPARRRVRRPHLPRHLRIAGS